MHPGSLGHGTELAWCLHSASQSRQGMLVCRRKRLSDSPCVNRAMLPLPWAPFIHFQPVGGCPGKATSMPCQTPRGYPQCQRKNDKNKHYYLLTSNYGPSTRQALCPINAHNCPVRPVLYSHLTDEQTEGKVNLSRVMGLVSGRSGK